MELSIVIEKMMILVLIMLVGFIARKAKLTDDEANRYFSRLLINVFLVCSILRSTVNVDPVLSGREMLLLFGLFALGFGIYWLMGYLTVTVFPMKKDRGITILLMVFINTVFLGFPIIEGLYGSEAIFIFDPDNRFNRPVPGKHVNVIKRWPIFPKVLKDAFIQEFSQEKLKNPTKRITEAQWEPVIARARDTLVACPHCGEETFADLANGLTKCMDCGKELKASHVLSIAARPESRDIPLTVGSRIFIDNDTVPEAAVVKDANGIMLLKNISSEQWGVVTPSGKPRTLKPQEIMPVREGMSITFRVRGSDYKAVIRNNQ